MAYKASLEKHIVLLYDLMQELRSNLALLKNPNDDNTVLDTAADQLSEIVDSSMDLSENIVKANVNIATITEGLLKQPEYINAHKQLESILGSCVSVRLASTRQETTSKRISNVIRTINQVEGILNSLVVRVGDGSVTGVETALSNINMMDEKDNHEVIDMRTHKDPKKSYEKPA